MVFKSEPQIISKSFTQFLEKNSILTILANMSMIFLILISNIYNTTPNKQILISFFLRNKKEEDEEPDINTSMINEGEEGGKDGNDNNIIPNQKPSDFKKEESVKNDERDQVVKETSRECNNI